MENNASQNTSWAQRLPKTIFCSQRFAFASAVAYIFWHFLYRLATAGNALYPFDGPFNDGPFQLHNPMRRMDFGQTLGADFSFFHGPLIPALHYPIHWLAGKSIHASEMARQVVSIFAFHAAWLAIFWAWTGKFLKSIIPWALAVMAADAWDMWQLAECDNSLYGLRGVCPLFATAAAIAPWKLATRSMVTGLFLGLGLLVGTELGLAALVATSLILMVCLVIKTTRNNSLRSLIWGLPTTLIALLVPLLLLGGTEAITDFFRFNLGIVPKDQFWYFGVPPNPFPRNFKTLFMVEPVRVTFLAATISLGLFFLWAKLALNPYRLLPLFTLFLSGIISSYALMGLLNPVYLGTIRRDMIAIALMAAFNASIVVCQKGAASKSLIQQSVAIILICSLVIWPSFFRYEGIFKASQVASGLGNFAKAAVALPQGTISPRLQTDLEKVLAEIDQKLPDPSTRQGQFWSTFSGLPEDRLNVLNPYCDYIIHALGSRRNEYLDSFANLKPMLVLVPGLSQFSYENWVRDTNWPFYELVYLNYKTILATSGHILLEKSKSWLSPGNWEGEVVANDRGEILLPPAQPDKILSIEVEYSTQSRWGWLPMIGQLPRWLLFRTGGLETAPVSLPPNDTTWRFGSRAKPGETVTLTPLAVSPWGGKLTVNKARWRWINTTGLKD